MPRKPEPEKDYLVSIHVTKGYRYASTQPGFTDPKTGKRIHRQLHWGKLDENNKFIPGKEYLLASVEERKKLVFPEDWDLSEIEKLSGMRKPGRPPLESQDESKLYGDVWLLDQVADKTGIREDLTATFKGNKEMVDMVLTVAYYMINTGGTYNQLASWQDIEKTPFDISMSSEFITKLVQTITEPNRVDLMRYRVRRMTKDSYCVIDSTSRSAWGNSLSEVRYGNNKEHLPLPQTLEVVAYSMHDHIPVYYRTFHGNMSDSRSLETIVQDLDSVGLKGAMYVTDRGCECILYIEMYIDRNIPAVVAAKTSQKFIVDKIKAFGNIAHHPEDMELDINEKIYYKQYDLEYRIEGHRDNVKDAENYKLNLYFDPDKRTKKITEIECEVAEQKANLEEMKSSHSTLPDDDVLKDKFCYFNLAYTKDARLLTDYALDKEKVCRRKLMAGFFANTTLKVNMTAMEAHYHYKLRDEQEKYFAMMKGLMGCDRQHNWSESAKEGARFILFVAQIIGCYLANEVKTKLADKYNSIIDVLHAMRPIRYIQHPGSTPYLTPFVSKQVDICEKLGLEIPEGCAPEYVVRKTNKGKSDAQEKGKPSS